MSDTPLGRFCWYELMTTDADAAQSFYTQVAPWTAQAWEGGETPYTMWMRGELPVGGVMTLPPEAAGAPPYWIAYVSTPDADAIIAKAREMGGNVVWGPMDIPMVGRVAGLQDPQGAMFALLQPASEAPGHDGPRELGEISWHELATTDPDGAWDFYSTLFGWVKSEAVDMGELGMYQMFSRAGQEVGAVYVKPDEVPVTNWLLYLRVPDVAKAVEAAKDAGGALLNGPMEVPGGDTVAMLLDPQGAAFALHSLGNG
jgi:predicted enzyme related to lactoylglutathione lyase